MLKRLNDNILITFSFVAMLIAAWLFSAAYSVWQERLLLCSSLQQVQTLLTKRQRFAGEHADYAVYRQQQTAKLAQLQAQVGKELQLNNVIQRLQKQAQAQQVELITLHVGQGEHRQGQQLMLQQIKIVATGDFFALLRWLRQSERAGCNVKQLRLVQGVQDKAKLTMELNAELRVTN